MTLFSGSALKINLLAVLNSLRSARFLAGITLLGVVLPAIVPVARACGMEMEGVMHAEGTVPHEVDVETAMTSCRSALKQAVDEGVTDSCCGENGNTPDECPENQDTKKPRPLFCNCQPVDSWMVAQRAQDSPSAALVLRDRGREWTPTVPALRSPRTSLNDPGSPPLDRTIVFGSFLN